MLPPTKARPPEDERYAELTHAIKLSLRQGSFRTGELLTQARDEKLFGHWRSFKNFVVGELRITEVQAYRLIFAFETLTLLASKQLPLPVNERQVRPLRVLPLESQIIRAWKRACKQKQHGQPTYLDVQREVNLLRSRESSVEEDQAYRTYRQQLEAVRTALRRATDIMASGDLEGVIKVDFDEQEMGVMKRKKKVLLELLLRIGVELGDHFKKVTGEEISFESRD
jgi:DNA-binding FrmR family transcriptional regulator